MIVLLTSLAVCLVLGIPIGYSLGLSGFFYFVFERPELLPILPQRFLAGMDSYAMIAMPLFIFIAVTFLYPIGLMLTRSIYDNTISSSLPRVTARSQATRMLSTSARISASTCVWSIPRNGASRDARKVA